MLSQAQWPCPLTATIKPCFKAVITAVIASRLNSVLFLKYFSDFCSKKWQPWIGLP